MIKTLIRIDVVHGYKASPTWMDGQPSGCLPASGVYMVWKRDAGYTTEHVCSIVNDEPAANLIASNLSGLHDVPVEVRRTNNP